jgi:HK97 family phage major capsid protein
MEASKEEQAAAKIVNQVRAMTVGTGSQGGFATVWTHDPTPTPTSAGSRSPYRALCRVEQTTSTEWRGLTSGGMTLASSTEGSEAGDNLSVLAQPAITTFRASGFVPVSIELLQDWDSIQDQLANEFQRAKDDLEAVKFTSGNGTSEPQGLLTGTTAGSNAPLPASRPSLPVIFTRPRKRSLRDFDQGQHGLPIS